MLKESISKSFKFHSKGLLTLTTDTSRLNREIYSCGIDDSVGIWKKSEEEDELDYDAHTCLNKCQSVIAVHGDDIYVGATAQNPVTKNDQQVVVKYEKEGFEPSAPLMTFSLEVTALALSLDGKFLVSGANDFLVKCLSLNDPNKGYDRYECSSLVVNVSIDPRNCFFSISTADGNVQFRTIEKSKSHIAQFKACSPFSHITFEIPRMQVVWPSRGEFVYIPASGGILVVDCMKWNQDRKLNLPEIAHETFSVAAISANDEFFASCTIQGTLVVWKMDGLQPIYAKSIRISPSYVTALVFSPFDTGAIVAAYSEGYLGTVKDFTTGTDDSTLKENNMSKSLSSFSRNSSKNSVGNLTTTDNTTTKAWNRIDSDDDSLNGDRNERVPSTNEIPPVSEVINTELFDNDEQEFDLGRIKSQFGFNEDGVFIGVGGSTASTLRVANNDPGPVTHLQQNFAEIGPSKPCATIEGMRRPKAFVAGATPFGHGQRYLMWNTYGTIRAFRSADESTIEITFHDATVHSEIVIDNTAENYVFGDLNTNLVALASRANSEKESKLYVQHISTWDVDSREWSTKLSNGEVVEALCVGAEFIAIFTSSRFVRIFSSAGSQRAISSLPGPLLTTCAWGNSFVVVHPTGGIIIKAEDEYEHQLVAEIYDVQPLSPFGGVFRHVKSLALCLGPETTLDWIAFSNAGRLVTMDSECTLRLYSEPSNTWTPILIGTEILKNTEVDYLWPIAVLERPTPTFRYVYCRNSKYPTATKSIIPTTIPWNIPILDTESERSKLESQLMVSDLLHALLKDTMSKLPQRSSANELSQLSQSYASNLVKLFALSLNVGREYRAVELAHLAPTPQCIQVMCNYAAKKERPNISEKIASIGREKVNVEQKLQSATTISETFINASRSATSVQTNEEIHSENRLAPNPIRVKRKLNDHGSNIKLQSSSNPFAKEKENGTEEDIFAQPKSNSHQQTDKENLLDESQLSNADFDEDTSQISSFFDASIHVDVSISSDVVSAKNPFKRSKVTNGDESDMWQEGADFFDQLSKTKRSSKGGDANILKLTKGIVSQIQKGRQTKLSFGGTPEAQ